LTKQPPCGTRAVAVALSKVSVAVLVPRLNRMPVKREVLSVGCVVAVLVSVKVSVVPLTVKSAFAARFPEEPVNVVAPAGADRPATKTTRATVLTIIFITGRLLNPVQAAASSVPE
jgi:hypothetical protein